MNDTKRNFLAEATLSQEPGSEVVIDPWRMFLGSFVPNWLMRKPWLRQGAKLAYGASGEPVLTANIPEPVPAPLAEGARLVASAAPRLMITESKPFSAKILLEDEISKMEELGDEMRNEIRSRTKR